MPTPPPIEVLIPESQRSDAFFVERTKTEWESGANRFDRDGERFFIAMLNDDVVGMCGLNIDPFLDDPSVGRVRHVYVAQRVRRRGIGRDLVAACLDAASGTFSRVELRTFDPGAGRFYESVGFTTTDARAATHVVSVADSRAGRGSPPAAPSAIAGSSRQP